MDQYETKCISLTPDFSQVAGAILTAFVLADSLHNMKTIAMTIDEPTLKRIDRLRASNSVPWKSRSEVIRQAVQQFVSRLERAAEEDREREIFRRHGARLNRQAAALMKEQAKP